MAVARLPDPFLRSPLRLASLRNRRRPHRQPRRPQRHRASHDFREAQPFPEAHQRPQRRHHRHQHLDRGTARHRQPLELVRHRDTPTPPTRPPPVHAVTRRAARGRSRKRTRSRAASKARRAVHSLILEFPWILGSCRKPGERCANVEECPEQPPWPPDGSFCMSGKTSGSIPTTPNGVVTTNGRKFYCMPQHLPVARDAASMGQAPFLHDTPLPSHCRTVHLHRSVPAASCAGPRPSPQNHAFSHAFPPFPPSPPTWHSGCISNIA